MKKCDYKGKMAIKLFIFFIISSSLHHAHAHTHTSERFLKFPDGFSWCVATSAHQNEGRNYNSDWWAFEQIPGVIQGGDTSEVATGHWDRVEEDINLMKDLGLKAYRFSVEWAKIEPSPGQFDQSVLDHYREKLEILHGRQITPMVTLLHFTLPQWVAEKGGLLSPHFPQYFAQYVRRVYTAFGHLVSLWITFNEPINPILQGYVTGEWPPMTSLELPIQERYGLAFDAFKHTLLAHAQAYRILHDQAAKSSRRKIQVGISHVLAKIEPLETSLLKIVASLQDAGGSFVLDRAQWIIPMALKTGRLKLKMAYLRPLYNDFIKKEFLKGIKGTQDFFGLNYYQRMHLKVNPHASGPLEQFQITTTPDPDRLTTEMGWEIYPEGLTEMLLKVKRHFPSLPVYITENGLADSNNHDHLRVQYIKDHLAAVHRAIRAGVDVRGYCHWTLIDNFEWTFGYGPKMGLFALDPETLERIPRHSTNIYKKIIKDNGFYSDPGLNFRCWEWGNCL